MIRCLIDCIHWFIYLFNKKISTEIVIPRNSSTTAYIQRTWSTSVSKHSPHTFIRFHFPLLVPRHSFNSADIYSLSTPLVFTYPPSVKRSVYQHSRHILNTHAPNAGSRRRAPQHTANTHSMIGTVPTIFEPTTGNVAASRVFHMTLSLSGHLACKQRGFPTMIFLRNRVTFVRTQHGGRQMIALPSDLRVGLSARNDQHVRLCMFAFACVVDIRMWSGCEWERFTHSTNTHTQSQTR